MFAKLSPSAIEERKVESRKHLQQVSQEAMEIGFETMYAPDQLIDFPKRPQWTKKDTKDTLEQKEETYFKNWKESIYNRYSSSELSYFEHNLEVWRQLWRVVEISDLVLFVVDARHPVLHFPPLLYDYVVKELGKKLVLVFNKIDLIGRATLDAWTDYFKVRFPGLLTASFSCYPREGFSGSDFGAGNFLLKKSKSS